MNNNFALVINNIALVPLHFFPSSLASLLCFHQVYKNRFALCCTYMVQRRRSGCQSRSYVSAVCSSGGHVSLFLSLSLSLSESFFTHPTHTIILLH
jgi:hypothetical protein